MMLFCISSMTVAYAKLPLRDPTRPPWVNTRPGAEYVGNLQVKAILIAPTGKTVIIGKQHLTIGDTIMGAKIIAIDAHKVTFRGRHGTFTVAMFQPIVKHPVAN